VVIASAALGGFAGAMFWLFLSAEALRDHTAGPAAVFEGLGFLMAGIFWSAQAVAKLVRVPSGEFAEFEAHSAFQKSLAACAGGLCLLAARVADLSLNDPRRCRRCRYTPRWCSRCHHSWPPQLRQTRLGRHVEPTRVGEQSMADRDRG
jgi:hypothetical protein